jgi:hypothetical protein
MDEAHAALHEGGGIALATLEGMCDKNSAQADGALKEAVGHLVELRNQLITARRAGTACNDELRCTNAILSSLFGVEFPIGDAQWQRICEARDALKDLLRKAQRDPAV